MSPRSTWMNAGTLGLLALVMVQFADSPKLVIPNVPDLTIKTRQTTDRPDSSIATEIIYLKGARQRRETIVEWPPHAATAIGVKRTRLGISITQCDERRTLLLNDEARTYAYSPIEDVSEHLTRVRRAAGRAPPREMTTGDDMTITIDSVDTGDRRQIGPYTARRVITTTTTERGPGASARTSISEQDGWYIDLPSADCWDWGGHPQPILVGLFVSGGRDRVHIKHRGTARRGYPIEETNRNRTDTNIPTTKRDLIEFSNTPLDAALFTVPSGYRPALRLLSGGYDLTKPDTLMNRLKSFWEEFRDWTNRLLP